MRFFYTRVFYQSVHSGPIRVVHGLFYCFFAFSERYCTFKMTPWYFGNRGVATPRYFGQRGVVTPWYPKGLGVIIFYLDFDIGQPWVNFKAINLKIVGHICSVLKSVKISD